MLSWHRKEILKATFKVYAIIGAAWLWNETSPLGWFSFRFIPKEERELAHLYEHRRYPYPGDEEAMREFIEKGGTIGTTIGPRGIIDKNGDTIQEKKQQEKFEREVQKLWLRMRNEVVQELEEQGYELD
eukprot:TRINITY_DN1745_c0_g1_i1.p1 TRINITY_DN1745_c0_g1~~TRINITY_DN1745_c0_g1_i1.p1  ORF type:complete len:129 (+),score=31.60 TRINITY_DN1745_c0_g1_i1:236-622(+)